MDASNERKPCLNDEQSDWVDDERALLHEPLAERNNRSKNTHRYLLIIQCVVLVCNVGLLLLNIFATHWINSPAAAQTLDVNTPYSPVRQGMEYTIQHIDTREKEDPFVGEPGPEVDAAWSKLLRSTTIRVSEEELRAMNQPSMSLSDGSGYVAYVETFHMLHCLVRAPFRTRDTVQTADRTQKRMYQYQYPEYYKELVDAGKLTLDHHVLRKGIMCNADPTLNTFLRDPSQPMNITGITNGPRKCVDWDRFEEWAYERAIGKDIHSLMMNGEFGDNGPKDLIR